MTASHFDPLQVTIMFSTHIFDGLEDWGTHVTHISNGRLGLNKPISQLEELERLRQQGAETVCTPSLNRPHGTTG